MRRRRKNFIHIKDVLMKNSKHIGINKRIKKYKLWTNWRNIMPSPIAKNTWPLRWHGEILVVGTPNSAWSQEMVYLKPEILEKIKKHLPKLKVKDIHFEVGSTPVEKENSNTTRTSKPLSKIDREKIEEWTESIHDDDLKTSISKALASVLRRKSTHK